MYDIYAYLYIERDTLNDSSTLNDAYRDASTAKECPTSFLNYCQRDSLWKNIVFTRIVIWEQVNKMCQQTTRACDLNVRA